MGRKIPIISFLCGVLTRKKAAAPAEEEIAKREDTSGSSTSAHNSPEEARISSSSAPECLDQAAVLPPPPGGRPGHMRTVSCQHNRSHSGVSRLVSSLSMRIIGGGGGGGGDREEKVKSKLDANNIKSKLMFKHDHHQDSIWKKTIILGEKCRVPDEEEDDILYDEKGNKFSTYHPKTNSGVLQFSKQTNSCIDQK